MKNMGDLRNPRIVLERLLHPYITDVSAGSLLHRSEEFHTVLSGSPVHESLFLWVSQSVFSLTWQASLSSCCAGDQLIASGSPKIPRPPSNGVKYLLLQDVP